MIMIMMTGQWSVANGSLDNKYYLMMIMIMIMIMMIDWSMANDSVENRYCMTKMTLVNQQISITSKTSQTIQRSSNWHYVKNFKTTYFLRSERWRRAAVMNFMADGTRLLSTWSDKTIQQFSELELFHHHCPCHQDPHAGVLLGVPFYRECLALLWGRGSRDNSSPWSTSLLRSPSTLSRIQTLKFEKKMLSRFHSCWPNWGTKLLKRK